MNTLHKILIFIISIVFTYQISAQTANITVDGNISDWDLTNDFIADMHRAGKPDKPVETKLYMRWVCPEKVVYVLVLQADPSIPILTLDPSNETFVKVDGTKKVDGGSGNDGTPPDFAWYGTPFLGNSNYAQGWEASFTLDEGTYTFKVHNNVFNDGESQTSSVELLNFELDCDNPLPVELTSFSLNMINNGIELEWETATELNNYGFEIEKKVDREPWEKIGFVNGYGNSNSSKYYSFIDKNVTSGKFYYRLKQIDLDGSFEYSDVIESEYTPDQFKLNDNYPNPFNPSTVISFSIPDDKFVKLSVFDVLGNEIELLENNIKKAGIYKYTFDANNLASGVYYYKLSVGNKTEIKKMMLIK